MRQLDDGPAFGRSARVAPGCLLFVGFGQGAAFGRIQRPVLAGAPGPAVLVARRPEFPARAAARDDVPLEGKHGVDAQAALPVLECHDPRFAVRRAALAGGARRRPALYLRLRHAVEQPGLAEGRIRAAHAVEDEEDARVRQPGQIADEALDLARMVAPVPSRRARTCTGRERGRKRDGALRSQRSRVWLQSFRLRTEFQNRDESMRWPPRGGRPLVLAPEEGLAGLVHELSVLCATCW